MNLPLRKFLLAAMLLFVGALLAPKAWAAYITSYKGVGVYGQCAVFVQRYAPAVLGITVPTIGGRHSCANIGHDSCGAHWTWDDSALQPTNTDRIANNGSNFPHAQDIVVWSSSLPGAKGYGHIAIVDSGSNRNNIIFVDSNWAGDEKGQIHNIPIDSYVLGWFRKKGTPPPPPEPEWEGYLDQPGNNTPVSGVKRIDGWGWDKTGKYPIRALELYVNGEYIGNGNYGEWRDGLGRSIGYSYNWDTSRWRGQTVKFTARLSEGTKWFDREATVTVASDTGQPSLVSPSHESELPYGTQPSLQARKGDGPTPTQYKFTVFRADNATWIGDATETASGDSGVHHAFLGDNPAGTYWWTARSIVNGQEGPDQFYRYKFTIRNRRLTGERPSGERDSRIQGCADGFGPDYVGTPRDDQYGWVHLISGAYGNGIGQDYVGGSGTSGIIMAKDNASAAYNVRGNIWQRYSDLGTATSFLGYPLTNEIRLDSPSSPPSPHGTAGYLSRFEGGDIYAGDNLGVFYVTGAIKTKYDTLGGWSSPLGFPTNDGFIPATSPLGTTGKQQNFEGGGIYTSSKGTHAVTGVLFSKYAAVSNGTGGFLGFPTSDPYSYLGGTRQDFEGGSLTDGVSFTLSLSPLTVVGGTKATGTLILPVAAPVGGVTIKLSSSNTSVATVPATVTVVAGQTKVTFSIGTAVRTSRATATITAKQLDVTRSATLTVNAAVSTISITQPAVDNVTLPVASSVLLAGQAKAASGHTISRVTVRLYRYANGTIPAAYWAGGSSWVASAQPVPVVGTTSWYVKVPTLLDGRYALVATATDNMGKSVSSPSRYFWVEATPRQVYISDVMVNEPRSGFGLATFTITLDKPSRFPLKVGVKTGNGLFPTAIVATDYSALVPTTLILTFAPGQTKLVVSVKVLADALDEETETFRMLLLKVDRSNIVVARGIGMGTILDSTPSPVLSINNVSLVEGNAGSTNAQLTVTLSARSARMVTVNYVTGNGMATAGSDYVSRLGSLTFAPGETTKTILVSIKGDAVVEANEGFTVTLSDLSNALLARNPMRGTVTITNDDRVSTNSVASPSGDAAPSAPSS